MQIFGLDPILIAILITVAGVALTVLLGWLKSTSSFNIKSVVASALIAFVASIQIVIVGLGVIPDGTSNLELGALLFGLLATVAGIDHLAKSAAKAAAKKK